MTKSCRQRVIGSFEFDLETGELHDASGRVVPMRPQTSQVMAALLSRGDGLVSKRDLMDEVWKDTHVTDDSLVQCVSEIRRALGPEDGKLLRTVPRHGYRIVSHPDAVRDEARAPDARKAGPGSDPKRRRSFVGRAAVLVFSAAAIMVTGVYYLRGLPAPRSDIAAPLAADGPTLAVLPFEGIGIPAEQGYVPEGLTDDLTTALARNKRLTVISRESAFLYRDSDLPADEIFRRLKVSHLLRGSLRSDGERLRINVRLSQAGHGKIVWAETFEGSLRHLFGLEARIISAVNAALTGSVYQPGMPADLTVRTSSPQAYRAFQLGRQLFFEFRDRSSNDRARQLFEEALSHDPEFAMAHAMLAMTYSFEAQNGWARDRREALARAEDAARMAISKDPENPLPYFVTGLVFRERGEYVKAMVEAERAIDLDPSYANAHVLLSTLLYYAGRPAESIERLKEAMRLNPHHPFQYNFHLGQAFFTVRQYEDAIGVLLEGLESNPSAERLHVWLAASYARAGLLDDAAWEAEQILTMNPGFSVAAASDAYPFEDEADRVNFADALRVAGLK